VWLDQLQDGACVWFGIGHELAAKPRPVTGLSFEYCREGYWESQQEDEWPGGAYAGASPRYEGTSVLAGMKVAQRRGFYSNYYWGLTLEQVVIGVGFAGPGVAGVNWHDGMDEVDENGFIHATGAVRGGHAIAVIGVRIVWKEGSARTSFGDVDLERSYFLLHNSWGRSWGVDGRAKISLADFDRLLQAQGEVAFGYRTDKLAA
jgi:hypothetical protein